MGGSGGGGARPPSGGGGAGGGALLIASSASVTVNGTITTRGGNGGRGPGDRNGGGGGAGGGIRLMAPIIDGAGSLNANGGESGGFFTSGGSHGRIRLEAFQHAFTGGISPTPWRVTPGGVFLPENSPFVRVVSVEGIPVPAKPSAKFVPPDLTLNADSAVTFAIEARYIPLGTVVQLRIYFETGSEQIVASTPLVGTLENSTATATAEIQPGFSRVSVMAEWDTQ